MPRLFAGAALAVLALTACGHTIEGPPPHIVALGVPATAPPSEPATVTDAVAIRDVQRASRAEVIVPAVATTTTDDVWRRLALCESNGNPHAVGGRGRYFGAFQFTLQTWRSMGMTGNPVDYSYDEQLAVAKRLQARSGWRNWPVCARRVLRA